MDYNLNGGVLIIGSLYWQNHRTTVDDDVRGQWRHNHLDIDNACLISVPIRYGRFSQDSVYTMVFDNTLQEGQFGKGKAVPFKQRILNWPTLRSEVEALSNAERKGKEFIKGTRAWCVCGIVFNPKVTKEKRDDILLNWRNALQENNQGFNAFAGNPASYCLSCDGELKIEWPNQASPFDFLIATSTQPKLRNGCTDFTVAEVACHVPNRSYFIPNLAHTIGTSQDRAIIKAIQTNTDLVRQLFIALITRYEDKKLKDKCHRYWSWHHCYDTFHSNVNDDLKALHVGNYLASWGMNRGSGGLLQKDYRIHIETINILSKEKYSVLRCFGKVDVIIHNMDRLIELKTELENHYASITFERMGENFRISPTSTLVSKILLGTLCCIPAYDDFLSEGLALSNFESRRFSTKGVSSLFRWLNYYDIESTRTSLPVTARALPVMKLLDIYFWSLGYQLATIEK